MMQASAISVTAQAIWQDYSASWQFWNQLRTVVSGIALVLVGLGLTSLRGGQVMTRPA